eukprot:GHRR01001887.1.p1 GENE.GHRR01001887.1~~GHRR01001887.1.p1  ORF type:complete len:268 (+),score=72.43 GHRR01001887.1:334-1137(+)
MQKIGSSESHQSVYCGAVGKMTAACARPLLEDWLHNMLHTQFFTPCQIHRESKKNEATHFCADCGITSRPLCAHCITSHSGHRLIQIRRYVYCDVVRASDMSPHLDISGVQTYIINQAKVMFLNQRPQSKMSRPGAPDACVTCSRTLREGCSYCSLACKVEALVAAGKLKAPASEGNLSDSSGCWPSTSHQRHLQSADGSGDSSSSELLQQRSSWLLQCGLLVAANGGDVSGVIERRHSDTDSDGRYSSTSHCCRRKQMSPRRSPLL